MRMTVEQIQNRLVTYMEEIGRGVRGVGGILSYFGVVFLAKTKLAEIIATLDKGGMLTSLGIINSDGIDVDLLVEASEYLIPKLPDRIEVGSFVFSHSDLADFFRTLKEEKDE